MMFRKVLAFAFCLDSIGVFDIAYRAGEARPERVAELAGWLAVMGEHVGLRLLLGVVAIVAMVRFSKAPGRVGMGLLALVATGINYTYCAEFTGSVPNVLVCSGLALFAWVLTFALAQFLWSGRGREPDLLHQIERLASLAALAAFGVYFFKAGLSKYLNSGWDWADGSKIRALMVMYTTSTDSVVGSLQEQIIHSALLSRLLAIVTLMAQLGAIVYPFTRRGRLFIGPLLLGFELSVYALAGILAPGNLALIVGFSIPWRSLSAKDTPEQPPRPLPTPRRSRLAVATLALLTLAAFPWAFPLAELGTPPSAVSADRRGQGPAQPPRLPTPPPEEDEPPLPPRDAVDLEYVLSAGQEAAVQALLTDVGFDVPLAGGYRFGAIRVERHHIRIELHAPGTDRAVAASLELRHIGQAQPGELTSQSFTMRSRGGRGDPQVRRHLNAAQKAIQLHDAGGFFVQAEKEQTRP